MRVSFIGHASTLVESGNVSILSDPWWRGPCFGAQWWNYPEPAHELINKCAIDYIYISHGHHDHFHPNTLTKFSRSTRVLVGKYSGLPESIRGLGFEVIEIPEDSQFSLDKDVHCRIISTYEGDTLLIVSDANEVCVNANDALHSLSAAKRKKFTRCIRKLYPRIDYLFCGYGTASHFPNCYVIPGKNRELSAAIRQNYFTLAWADIVDRLAPRYGFPFAADVVLLEDDLFWSNEPIHNALRPGEVLRRHYPNSSSIVIDIAPGFVIENGMVVSLVVRKPFSNELVLKLFADSITRVNRSRRVDHDSLKEIVELIKQNIHRCRPYLETYVGDYKCLIRFRMSDEGISVTKNADHISATIVRLDSCRSDEYDLMYTTRPSYLKHSLTSQFGYEVLFVGSGGMFEFSKRDKIGANIQREMMLILRRIEVCPSPRTRQPRTLVYRFKKVLKRILGSSEEDLYELAKWTTFDDRVASASN